MTDAPTPGRGRRRGSALPEGGTRSAIIRAATAEFAAIGYDRTSLRGVARRAGVDPALVHHYFADKAGLFVTAMELPIRPHEMVESVLAVPRADVGTTIVRTIITALDGPGAAGPVLSVIRAAIGHEFAARMLRQFLLREVLQRVTDQLGVPDGELRAGFAATQVVGLIVARYGLRLDSLAAASAEGIVAHIGPVVQWHLTGEPGVTIGGPVPNEN